jgi:hypothetical protein
MSSALLPIIVMIILMALIALLMIYLPFNVRDRYRKDGDVLPKYQRFFDILRLIFAEAGLAGAVTQVPLILFGFPGSPLGLPSPVRLALATASVSLLSVALLSVVILMIMRRRTQL